MALDAAFPLLKTVVAVVLVTSAALVAAKEVSGSCPVVG